MSDDLTVFERTAVRFLDDHFPIEHVRSLARGEVASDLGWWRDAAALGWTTLLVPESAGGGSITGNGLADLAVVARLAGRRAAPGPLLTTNLVAAALGRWGSTDLHTATLGGILDGTAVASWAHRSTCTAATDGDDIIVDGSAGAVESAADAAVLLIGAAGPGGRAQFLVPTDAPGVTRTPLSGVDLTRRFCDVCLDAVRIPGAARIGEPGTGDDHHDQLVDLAAVLALAEMSGAVEQAFSLTLEWVENRYSFGRPLGSYQEIKHRMADLRTQVEAADAVARRAAALVGTGAPAGREWASAGMVHVGRQGPEVVQDCIQLHGGIGVTFDSDLHLYLRRVALDANLYGSPSWFARRLGHLVIDRERAA